MRTIKKRRPPAALVEWRQERRAAASPATLPFDYDAMRRSPGVVGAVERGLFEEQGGLCAYTGRRIHLDNEPSQHAKFHLEHLKGQTRCRREAEAGLCEYGFDTHYENLVACWPEPNQEHGTPYGAVSKGDWPEDAAADAAFVSPLREDCSKRFGFDRNGRITPVNQQDEAARMTIKKLGLAHRELEALRKAAIKGTLTVAKKRLTLSQARKVSQLMDDDERALDRGENVRLREFCFAIRPAIVREIQKLEGIRSRRPDSN